MLLITITVTNEQQISCNITQVNFGESGNRFYTQPSNIHEREEKTRYMWHECFCETNQSVKILQMSLTNTYTELKSSQLNLHPLPLTSDP